MSNEEFKNLPPEAQAEAEEMEAWKTKYQTVDDIQFVEVPTNQNPDITVFAKEGQDIHETLKERLKEDYWWLNERWQNKSLPREQIEVTAGGQKVNLYNWGDRFTDQQMTDVEKAIKNLTAKTKFGLAGLEYILIDTEEVQHRYNPNDLTTRGQSNEYWQAMILYPPGVKESPYRNGEMGDDLSELAGIIVHEIGHLYLHQLQEGTMLINHWNEEFAEFNGEKKDFLVKNSEQTVSSYGKLNSSDDFCECLVAAIYCLDKLREISPEKAQFIKRYILEDQPEDIAAQSEKKTEIELPRTSDTKRYSIKESGIIFK